MDKRGCYATGERRLAFYHHYSLLNCYMECVSNYTGDVRGLPHMTSVLQGTGGSKNSQNLRTEGGGVLKSQNVVDVIYCRTSLISIQHFPH